MNAVAFHNRADWNLVKRRSVLGRLLTAVLVAVPGVLWLAMPAGAQTDTAPLPSKAPPSIYYGPDGKPLPGSVVGDPAAPKPGTPTPGTVPPAQPPATKPAPGTGPVPSVPGGFVFTPPALAAAANAAKTELEGAVSARDKAKNTVAVAKEEKAKAEDNEKAAGEARQQADNRRSQAEDEVAKARTRLAEAAVSTYVGRPDRAATESAARAYIADDVQLSSAAVRAVRQRYVEAVEVEKQAGTKAGEAAKAQEKAAGVIPITQQQVNETEAKLTATEAEINRLTTIQRAASDELTAAENEIKIMITLDQQAQASKVAGGTGGTGDRTPSVLGDSVMTASDIAAWYRTLGHTERTTEPMDRVAAYYLHESKVLGVRADLAYAQAMLETGGFTSPLTAQSNYAGIGACDSCATGYGYTGAQLGVRAQIQLLRAYADPSITSAGFGYPAVKTQPETLGVRGCCDTWGRLTGVWATDSAYGPKIMEIYHRMLTFTIAKRLAAQPGDYKARQEARAKIEAGQLPAPTGGAGTPPGPAAGAKPAPGVPGPPAPGAGTGLPTGSVNSIPKVPTAKP